MSPGLRRSAGGGHVPVLAGSARGHCRERVRLHPWPGQRRRRLGGFPCYSLVGKTGLNGTPFEVGNSAIIDVTSPGGLYLSVDDNFFSDNIGSLTVQVATDPGV